MHSQTVNLMGSQFLSIYHDRLPSGHIPPLFFHQEEEEEEREFYLVTHIKIYNSGYRTEIVNEQCKTGDPLETSGGLYRGPPSMLIYVNTIKCCACETLHLVQSSIPMNVKLLQ